jgi:hypothetical protein
MQLRRLAGQSVGSIWIDNFPPADTHQTLISINSAEKDLLLGSQPSTANL